MIAVDRKTNANLVVPIVVSVYIFVRVVSWRMSKLLCFTENKKKKNKIHELTHFNGSIIKSFRFDLIFHRIVMYRHQNIIFIFFLLLLYADGNHISKRNSLGENVRHLLYEYIYENQNCLIFFICTFVKTLDTNYY